MEIRTPIVGNNNSAFAKHIFDLMSGKLEDPLSDSTFIVNLTGSIFILLVTKGIWSYKNWQDIHKIRIDLASINIC